MLPDYSVLMSVYYKEKPEYLKESLESIAHQTIISDDIVLVCDGPLTEELDAVIADAKDYMGDTLNVIRLPENKGLGNALNVGIKQCRHELVARMDSDDISRPDRCEKQLKVFMETPELSIVSGTVEEFDTDPSVIRARRVLPEKNEDIRKFAKSRNPFNHPCVMYRKSAVARAGGYADFYLLEDYFLWIRMLIHGFKGYNIQEPLLWMRAGSDMYKRRSGWKYAKSQVKLFWYMKKSYYISIFRFAYSAAVRVAVSLVPNGLRTFLFGKLLRK